MRLKGSPGGTRAPTRLNVSADMATSRAGASSGTIGIHRCAAMGLSRSRPLWARMDVHRGVLSKEDDLRGVAAIRTIFEGCRVAVSRQIVAADRAFTQTRDCNSGDQDGSDA